MFAQVTNPPIDPLRGKPRDVAGDLYRSRAERLQRDLRPRPPVGRRSSHRSCSTPISTNCWHWRVSITVIRIC
ncbi:hypothetical protein ACLK12_17115 [Escherichia coli]